jgi:hypothetical protein
MKARHQLQTIAVSYKEICEGASPWIPLGMFMHDFFGNFVKRRKELLKDPIQVPENVTLEQYRWAVFCVASVEYLCQKYNLACPRWVDDPRYTLAEPWYCSADANMPDVRKELEEEAPEPFRKRNIYCSDRIYANKYEIAEDLQLRRAKYQRGLQVAQQSLAV